MPDTSDKTHNENNKICIKVHLDEFKTGTNTNSSTDFTFNRATIGNRSNETIDIDELLNDQGPISDSDVVVFEFYHNKECIANTTIESHGLKLFLQNYRSGLPKDFCCSDFVNQCCFGKEVIKTNHIPPMWSACDEKNFSAGEYLRIVNCKGRPIHFALNIGQDLYLSLFGAKGPLIVTSITEMLKAFDGTKYNKIKAESIVSTFDKFYSPGPLRFGLFGKGRVGRYRKANKNELTADKLNEFARIEPNSATAKALTKMHVQIK